MLFRNRYGSYHILMTAAAKIIAMKRKNTRLARDERYFADSSGLDISANPQAGAIEAVCSIQGREGQDNGDPFFDDNVVRLVFKLFSRYLDDDFIAFRICGLAQNKRKQHQRQDGEYDY